MEMVCFGRDIVGDCPVGYPIQSAFFVCSVRFLDASVLEDVGESQLAHFKSLFH